MQRKHLIFIVVFLVGVASLALVSGILRKKTTHIGKDLSEPTDLRCSYDGTTINPLYGVDAYLSDDTVRRFSSIHNAVRWLEGNRDKVLYFTVVDEVTGRRFDSTLGHFVESDVVTVPEVSNRIHVFFSKEDAEKHAKQFNGKLLDNPFGDAFQLPETARLDAVTIGVQSMPDAMPLRLAIFRPIFKENKLNVKIVQVNSEEEGLEQLAAGTIDGFLCDLPAGVAATLRNPSTRIIKNMLRANPFRPLFGLVAAPEAQVGELSQLVGKNIALPKGTSFRFYFDFFLKQAGLSSDSVVIEPVDSVSEAWDKLTKGQVAAAFLRSPYTVMAMQRKWRFLADDRSLPWMSVLVVRRSMIEEKTEALKRFVFALEQSVLALNLKPDEFVDLLREQGGIPQEARGDFPMPIFEGANAPSEDEIAPVAKWLLEKGVLERRPKYNEIVDARFLPDPNDVGLAFCCN